MMKILVSRTLTSISKTILNRGISYYTQKSKCVKGEVDGSTTGLYHPKGQLGVAGILIDKGPEPIALFMMRAGRGDIMVSETLAIIRMMEFSLAEGYQRLAITTDRADIVTCLLEDKASRNKIAQWGRYRYKILLPRFKKFSLQQVKGDPDNKDPAHYLALIARKENKVIHSFKEIKDEIKRAKIAAGIKFDNDEEIRD